MSLGKTPIMGFIAIANAAKAREFYEKTLGLKFVEDSPFALVFEVGAGTMLRIQKLGEKYSPPQYTMFGWRVEDIAAKVRELVARGVTFMDPGFVKVDADRIWTTPDGSKVAWFKDPDGNTLSLTQLA